MGWLKECRRVATRYESVKGNIEALIGCVDPVEINADLTAWGGLNVLKIRLESIRRL